MFARGSSAVEAFLSQWTPALLDHAGMSAYCCHRCRQSLRQPRMFPNSLAAILFDVGGTGAAGTLLCL
jgi:hypothetical protein